MQTFAQALISLVLSGVVERETAANAATQPARLPRHARAGGEAGPPRRGEPPTPRPRAEDEAGAGSGGSGAAGLRVVN